MSGWKEESPEEKSNGLEVGRTIVPVSKQRDNGTKVKESKKAIYYWPLRYGEGREPMERKDGWKMRRRRRKRLMRRRRSGAVSQRDA